MAAMSGTVTAKTATMPGRRPLRCGEAEAMAA